MELSVISIGAMAFNSLWGEKAPVRAGHSTTTLVRSGDVKLLIDPGLPEQTIVQRLSERANLRPADITHVFLTSFRPDARRGIRAFEDAVWWVSEAERESVGVPILLRLKDELARDDDERDEELIEALRADAAVLERCRAAPDSLARGVDLFPLPGVTPGMSGALLGGQRHTTLVCGDAIPTAEHLERGQAPAGAQDLDKARESLAEAVEIADMLVLGRDNIVVNPTKRLF
jgi:glyoxylase-like metal-dependent hydrolase (beta-lactamase superfamily II)